MQSMFWLLANRTAETQFIYNLFHLLLAGLTLLVLLRQFRPARNGPGNTPGWLLPLGFVFLVVHFALNALHFGAAFFFRTELAWASFERFSDGLMACGFLIVIAGSVTSRRSRATHLTRWVLAGCGLILALIAADMVRLSGQLAPSGAASSPAEFGIDVLVLLAVGIRFGANLRNAQGMRPACAIALIAVGLFLILRGAPRFLPQSVEVYFWNAQQHVLSLALFAFAWGAGESSPKLLDRIFVRLNLTFIILASFILLITAGMEKYQYLRMAEERSLELAEFLRGHIAYYRGRGENVEGIFHHPEVLRRVVVEFGTLPELREVDVFLDGRHASFRYTSDFEVREELVRVGGSEPPHFRVGIPNEFQMIRLPLVTGTGDHIEFWGTMDYVNEYIGRYIILIYSLFTIMVGLASGVVGIIVNDADRRLRQQYEELQKTHQQLAQAAKLASVGQLAGGMAHEINTPITSILSLASHLAEDKSGATLPPRHRKSLQVIAQQAERVSRIVGRLLTFARQPNMNLGRVDVGELLDTAIAMVQYRLRDHAIQLRWEVDSNLPPILGDADRLTEVFVNLLGNAIDSMPNGGTLTVRAFPALEPEAGVRVEVADTGQGIPPEHLPRIFDPFFTTKEPGRGTGLGLSISHGIVKDHGGRIAVESEPGRGTRLVVTLPTGGEWR